MVFWIGLQYLKNNTLWQKKCVKMFKKPVENILQTHLKLSNLNFILIFGFKVLLLMYQLGPR